MRVRLDEKHTLCSDEHCCWITQAVTPEGRKPYEKRVSGYVPTFQMAVESYVNKKINSSEAKEISQLASEVLALVQEVRQWEPERAGRPGQPWDGKDT